MFNLQIAISIRTTVCCFVLTSFLTGCTSVGIITDQNEVIGKDEAIILTKIHSPEGSIILSSNGFDDIYDAPISTVFRTILLKEGENFVALRVKKDEKYKINRYNFTGSRYVSFQKQPFYFEASSEVMTYAGDFVIALQQSKNYNSGKAIMVVLDNEKETIKKMKLKYPILFNKYGYKKLMASKTEK